MKRGNRESGIGNRESVKNRKRSRSVTCRSIAFFFIKITDKIG
ncbi:hypothetical protein [Moorena sp. SIO2C4]|nr:hypothetical protein [Moorena sp. SIO2C4]